MTSRQALLIASDGDGLSLSKRRITLSTSGVVPEIFRTGEEIGVMLAISLHAVRDDLRDLLVPINKKYPLKELIDACRTYPGLSNARRITFEYVMLKDVNDSLEDAKGLIKLLKGVPAKINLIPFNPWPGTNYQCSDWEQIEKFADFINSAGYASPIRTPARPRHSCRLRPAEIGIGTHAQDRSSGLRGDDDRQSRRRRLISKFDPRYNSPRLISGGAFPKSAPKIIQEDPHAPDFTRSCRHFGPFPARKGR